MQVGLDAADEVVLDRADRDPGLADVHAAAQALVEDGRKAVFEVVAVLGGDVHKDVVLAAFSQLARDAAGDDVARGELCELVLADHETLAGLVFEQAALAADGLGDEEGAVFGLVAPETRGVELDELHVAELRARAHRGHEPVAGRDGGVRADLVDLPDAAGGDDDVRRIDNI